MVSGTCNELVTGAYKPKNITGPHCMDVHQLCIHGVYKPNISLGYNHGSYLLGGELTTQESFR